MNTKNNRTVSAWTISLTVFSFFLFHVIYWLICIYCDRGCVVLLSCLTDIKTSWFTSQTVRRMKAGMSQKCSCSVGLIDTKSFLCSLAKSHCPPLGPLTPNPHGLQLTSPGNFFGVRNAARNWNRNEQHCDISLYLLGLGLSILCWPQRAQNFCERAHTHFTIWLHSTALNPWKLSRNEPQNL